MTIKFRNKVKKVAAIQFCSSDNLNDNLKKATNLIKNAISLKAKLIVLPEEFAFLGSTEEEKINVSETLGKGLIQDHLSKIAKKNNVWILAGSVPIISDAADKIFRTSILWDNKGIMVNRYNKIHLFDANLDVSSKEYKNLYKYNESSITIPGNQAVCHPTPFGKIGFSICYDLRFPELYRSLMEQGADIFTVPSAFIQHTGKSHWKPLLQARAIENFCYVIAANQTGIHANHKASYGHSMIIDPWGTMIASMKEEEGVITADIDLDKVKQYREAIPALSNRHWDKILNKS